MTRTNKLVRFFLAASAAGTLLGACSTTPIPTITATVTSPAAIGKVTPPSGTYFAQVAVEMLNNTPSAYGMWSYYFQLTTTPGNLGLGAPADANAAVETPCSYDVTVGPMGKYECNLVFEVPCGQTPYALVYTLSDSVAGVGSFTPPTCSATGTGGSSSSSSTSSGSGTGGSSSSASTSTSSGAGAGAGGSDGGV